MHRHGERNSVERSNEDRRTAQLASSHGLVVEIPHFYYDFLHSDDIFANCKDII